MRFNREHQAAAKSHCAFCGHRKRHQITKIAQRIGRRQQVVGGRLACQKGHQFSLDQVVIELPFHGLAQHALGQIDAGQGTRKRRQQRTTQAGAAAAIQHVQCLGRGAHTPGDFSGNQRWRLVRQVGQLGIKTARKRIEHAGDVGIGGAHRHVLASTGRQVVPRVGIIWFGRDPRGEHRAGLVGQSQVQVGHGQQAAQGTVARCHHQALVALRQGLAVAAQAQVQASQVLSPVGICRVQFNHPSQQPLGVFSALGLAQQQAQIAHRIQATAVQFNGPPVQVLGGCQIAALDTDVRQIVVKHRLFRIGSNRQLDQVVSPVKVAVMGGQQAQQVQGVGLQRCLGQHAAVDLLGFVELTCSMVLHALAQLFDQGFVGIAADH